MMKEQSGNIFVVILCLLIGCTNPFNTRTPEEPEGDDPIAQNLQTDPTTLLSKIQLAFQQKDTQVYHDCFADTALFQNGFMFIPEQNETDRLLNWLREDERTYFFNLVNDQNITTVDVSFSNQSLPTPLGSSPDTLEIDFNYDIEAEFRTKTERYQGRSILKLLKSNEELWYIFEWLDLQNADFNVDSTWSTLKANYRISG